MHTLFHNTPARREDFTLLTKSTKFTLPFCGPQSLENLPVVERALEVWPSVTMYMEAVRTKKTLLKNSKLYFYMSVTRTFSPFLTTYQTDKPLMPFLANNLSELMKVIIIVLYSWLWPFYVDSLYF